MTAITKDIELTIQDLQRQIYDLRRRVAEYHNHESIPQDGCSMLLCRAGEDQVAFLLDLIREVVPIASLTSLPEAPAWVLGQLNLRGQSIPVLDVTARIDRARREVQLSDLIVICEIKGRSVGLLVQEVGGITQIKGAELMDGGGDIPHAPYLIAQFNHKSETVLILSVVGLVESSDLPIEDPALAVTDPRQNKPASKKKTTTTKTSRTKKKSPAKALETSSRQES